MKLKCFLGALLFGARLAMAKLRALVLSSGEPWQAWQITSP
jgi:hypothetical protein